MISNQNTKCFKQKTKILLKQHIVKYTTKTVRRVKSTIKRQRTKKNKIYEKNIKKLANKIKKDKIIIKSEIIINTFTHTKI